ncbi:MAG: protein-export chaperone SecB [Desulfobacteraceae bacterium]|nr:protein-export chaperone SecB [Desulfobacteraceae bacterium]
MANDKEDLTPKEYSDILKQVSLESIFFTKYNVKSARHLIGPDMNIAVKYDTSFEINPDDNRNATVKINYRLTVYKEKKSEYALLVICEIISMLNSKKDFSEQFLKIYKMVNLNHNTWPYFRSFVQDAANRAGIPPLTLPFYYQQ